MNTRWNRAAGMSGGNAPQVADTKRIGACLRQRRIVPIVSVFNQEVPETSVISATVYRQESGMDMRYINHALGMVVTHSLTRLTVIGAQPRISFARCAINMKRKNVGSYYF